MEDQIEITPDVQAVADVLRLDAVETAIFASQLEHVKAKSFDVLYPAFKARQFVPVSHECDPADQTVTYYQWDSFGAAKAISNYGMDLPNVDVAGKEFSAKIKEIGASYTYTVNDVRVALKTGTSLDQKRAAAARRAIEAGIDDTLAWGLPEFGMPGLLNHPNVSTVTLPTGTWSSASAENILKDLNYMVQTIIVATKQVHTPDTLILDTVSFARLSQTVAGNQLNDTIMGIFLKTNPYIKNIDQWVKLDTASAAGGPMILCYLRNPDVAEAEIPVEFEQHPLQPRNLEFVTNCTARVSGVQIRYPNALCYATNM